MFNILNLILISVLNCALASVVMSLVMITGDGFGDSNLKWYLYPIAYAGFSLFAFISCFVFFPIYLYFLSSSIIACIINKLIVGFFYKYIICFFCGFSAAPIALFVVLDYYSQYDFRIQLLSFNLIAVKWMVGGCISGSLSMILSVYLLTKYENNKCIDNTPCRKPTRSEFMP